MSSPYRSVWIGYDPREALAFSVAKYSIRRFNKHVPICGLVLDDLRRAGLYWRETTEHVNSDGRRQLRDVISDAPMSTEFSNSRFLVPKLAKHGWALYLDCDVVVRRNLTNLFSQGMASKAVMCVKHDHEPEETCKMDGQIQTSYSRKNWSSVVLWNCEHPANERLTIEMINTLPGRDLHRFCWLNDDEIGELPLEWNYLVGVSKMEGSEPAIAHFTRGLPDVPGYEDQEYADEWRELRPFAVGAL